MTPDSSTRTSTSWSAPSGSTTTPTTPASGSQIRDELRQPFGLLHGGVMSTLVESVCSRATALAVHDEGMVAMGQSINVNFIRPITEGGAEVRARARHRGRTTWVWEAEVLDDDGKRSAPSGADDASR